MILGFVAAQSLNAQSRIRVARSKDRALGHFPWLNELSLKVGNTELKLWGHGQLADWVHRLADGTLFALIGSPVGNPCWQEIEKQLTRAIHPEDFALPWDGRFILLKISPDGRYWTMWNDWVGSIPVFHAQIGEGWIASTLEPVVVAAADYTPNDFFLPGLVSLLVNGHYLGDWTLFKGMNVVPPDCVAEWDGQGFRWKRLWTVKPSDDRWDKGWDELVDEMYELSRQAISDVLKTQPSWILPLSGGLDSRLIAAVGAELGVNLRAYTYGPAAWNETIYARKVARTLGLPWKRVDLGTQYLAKYTRMWADWFGSALHFHGMYQMPFLEYLKSEPSGPILQGYMGDPLAGNHVRGLIAAHSRNTEFKTVTDGVGIIHWRVEEIKSLFRIPITEALAQMNAQIEQGINAVDGAWFQKLMFLDFWNRQRLFIYYQPMMYDYWRGVGTPFHNKDYTKFCLSLPRLALENRYLQKEMFRRFYPHMARIPGTYAPKPFVLTGHYLLKRRIARYLPKPLRRGPLREFNPLPNTLDSDCLKASGRSALWPIYEAWDRLSEWIDMNMVSQAIEAAQQGNLQAVNKLEAVQTLAYRLLDDSFD